MRRQQEDDDCGSNHVADCVKIMTELSIDDERESDCDENDD